MNVRPIMAPALIKKQLARLISLTASRRVRANRVRYNIATPGTNNEEGC